jgi:hypothetical protein
VVRREGWTVEEGDSLAAAIFVVPITSVDPDICFYLDHFMGEDHTNYVGRDPQLGAVVVSIKRETAMANSRHTFRAVVRSTEGG